MGGYVTRRPAQCPEQWRHIPGEINPTDLPTRRITAAILCNNTLWLEGPEFLTNTNKPWPERIPGSTAISTATKKEMKSGTYASAELSTEQDRLNPSRYSSWRRLVRVTAWVKRFLTNSKTPLESRNLAASLSDRELLFAKQHWVRQAQAEVFPGGTKDQRLIQLTPMLDSDGLLRIDGRLKLAKDLPYQTRHPIILPTHLVVTRLIIVDTHEKLGHSTGAENVLTEFRTKFWIVKGRQTVKTIMTKCLVCRKKFLAQPEGQKMAPLPTTRLTLPLRAFEGLEPTTPGVLNKTGTWEDSGEEIPLSIYLCSHTCCASRDGLCPRY